MQRYQDYKDSGINWLGPIPSHWETCALKRIATLRSGDSIAADDIQESGDFPVYGGNGLRGYTSRFSHEGERVLVGRQGALCGNVNYALGRFWASEHAIVLSPVKPVATRWLGEMLRTMNLNQYSVSAAQPGLAVDALANLYTAYPPLDEQIQIANFLERELAEIDALIAEQERLIDLLTEKRQAVISHAVTKGLNPDAPTKPSGIEWLGDVPAHWRVMALRVLANVVRGASPRPAGDDRYFGGTDVPWVTVAEITKDDNVDLNETSSFLTTEGAALSRTFPPGTVLYSNSGATLGVPKILRMNACANDGVLGFLNLRDDVSPEFLYHYLHSLTGVLRDMVKQGSGQPNLNTDIVKSLRIPLPPRPEQVAIVEHLRALTGRFRELTDGAALSIALLEERRAALISAAVTGQIDVREHPPEEVA